MFPADTTPRATGRLRGVWVRRGAATVGCVPTTSVVAHVRRQ